MRRGRQWASPSPPSAHPCVTSPSATRSTPRASPKLSRSQCHRLSRPPSWWGVTTDPPISVRSPSLAIWGLMTHRTPPTLSACPSSTTRESCWSVSTAAKSGQRSTRSGRFRRASSIPLHRRELVRILQEPAFATEDRIDAEIW